MATWIQPLRRHLIWTALVPTLVIAAIVTAAQIAEAVRNSPNSDQWLRDNAQAVANLAVRVESSGGAGADTRAYNGTCCWGVLQMTASNIRTFGRMSPEEYRELDLQSQINTWAALTVPALNARAPRALAAMATFDGRPVDVNLVLSCAQLGPSNCQRMLDSGRCNGFADSNGTTICGMADRIAGVAGMPGGTPPVGSPPGGSAPGGGSVFQPAQSVDAGFQQGSGVSMAHLKTFLHGLAVAVTLLVVGSALLGLLRQYGNGRIAAPALILASKKAGLIVILTFIVLTLV